MRLGNKFLTNRGLYLGDYGYKPDAGQVSRTSDGGIVFYHYTREEKLEQILSPNSGLFARLKVDVSPNPPEEFKGCYMAEGFLEPRPAWLTDCPYFGDLGIQMVRKYIGNVLLKVEIPGDYSGLFIADYAHVLEAKSGSAPLQLGYDCSAGREATQAYINSYIPVAKYLNGHIAPVMQATRKDQGIVIPSEYLSIALDQPLG